MFKSKRKTFVSSFGSSLYEFIPNTVRYSVNEALAHNESVGMTIVDNLMNGVNQRMRRGLKYAEKSYFYGLPQGQLKTWGINEPAIQAHLNALEGQTVELRDIHIDYESPELELFELLHKRHGWDGYNIFHRPSGRLLVELNKLVYETRTDWIQDTIQEVTDTYTYTTTSNGVTTTSTATVLYLSTQIQSEENQAFFADAEEKPLTNGEWIIRNRIFSDGYSNTGLPDSTYIVTYGVKTALEAIGTFRVIQTIETSEQVLQPKLESSDPDVYVTEVERTVNTFDEPVTINREIERDDVITEELTLTLNPEIKLLVFYKVGNDYKLFVQLPNKESPANLAGNTVTSLPGKFYPVINLRDNNRDPTREEMRGLDQFKTTKKLGKRLGIDYEELVDAINENPDIKEIDFAHLVMGINVKTETREGIEYLHQFFKDVSLLGGFDKAASDAFEAQREATEEARKQAAESGNTYFRLNRGYQANTIEIVDRTYRANIIYDYIDVKTVTGYIGKKGTVTKQIIIGPTKTSVSTAGYNVLLVREYSDDLLILKKQTSDTEYEEVTVKGLTHVNFAYLTHTVITQLSDIGNEEKEGNFIIPLYEPSVKKLSITRRDALHYEAQQVVINTYNIIKIKWYQQSWFKVVLFVASFVITGNPFAGAAWSAAVAAGTQAVILFIAKMVLTRIFFSLAFRLIARALGNELALAIAVLVAAYTFGKAIEAGSFKAVPYAEDLIMIATNLSNGVGYNINKEIQKLMGEQDAFITEMKDKFDELKLIQDDLDFQKFIDPMWFIDVKPREVLGEDPEVFFNKTVNNTNPGILSFKLLENYVDIMLTLPEFKDSIKEEEKYA